MLYSMATISVANAVIYLPIWAALQWPASGHKIVEQVAYNWATFHPPACGCSIFFFFFFFFQICQFPVNSERF